MDLVAEGAAEGFREGMLKGLGRRFASLTIPIRVWVIDGLVARQELDIKFRIEGEDVNSTVRVDLVEPGDHYTVEVPADGDVEDITEEMPRYQKYLSG